ncbi:hypothetical protein FQA39_LY00399 [Lamprigera yunnana]|nr:hypothetical protein FQA39_LY00399 [Lamprigera yunnana]
MGRKTCTSTVITSTPYYAQLEKATKAKEEKEQQARDRAKTNNRGISSSDDEYSVSSATSHLIVPPGVTPSKEDDACCLYCDDRNISEDSKGGLDNVCVMCSLWAHVDCVAGEKDAIFVARLGDNAIPTFRFYRSAQPRFPLEAHSEAASALNANNSDIEDDVAETTSADIGDCDLLVPEDEEEDEENEEEDEENVENKISDSEIEASGNSRRTNKAISNLKCKKYEI